MKVEVILLGEIEGCERGEGFCDGGEAPGCVVKQRGLRGVVLKAEGMLRVHEREQTGEKRESCTPGKEGWPSIQLVTIEET